MEARPQAKLRNAAWASAVVNLVLCVGKGIVGTMTGSRALVADAVHSAADLVGSAAVIVGLRIARKPPDDEHPYGHGRAELISSFVVSLFLIGAGLDVGYASIRSLFGQPSVPRVEAAYTAAAAIVIKEAMYQYTYRLGKRLSSASLIASAHDHRSDVFASIAALVGILLSLLGQALHQHWLVYMDAVAGGVVAVFVLRIGYQLAYESLQVLMDRTIRGEDVYPYRRSIEQCTGVEHIDALRVRDHGQYVIIDCEISVKASMTVDQGHDIAAGVRKELTHAFPRVQDVFVHVNPYYPGDIGLGEDEHD